MISISSSMFLFAWATPGRAYAGQVVRGVDGRYYWYVPINERESPASDQPRDWSRIVRSFHGGTPTSRARSASRIPRGAPL